MARVEEMELRLVLEWIWAYLVIFGQKPWNNVTKGVFPNVPYPIPTYILPLLLY